jgi:hypothetical protein
MRQAVVRSLALAALFVVASTAVVLGYAGQVAGQVSLGGPSATVSCSSSWFITAHVTEAGTGNPIQGQPVHWTITSTPDNGDSIASADTVTDQNGDTQTTLNLTSTPGDRTVEAQADSQTGRMSVDCAAGGLPPTATAGPSVPTSPFNYGLLLAAAAVLTGLGIFAFRAARR